MTKSSKKSKIIYITGPEASGKTHLAEALSKKLHSSWVPEYAREYLEKLGRPYKRKDIVNIGKQQWKIQKKVLKKEKSDFLICDTGFLVLKIWMEFRYDKVDPWIEKKFQSTSADLFLLCKPDIPWEPDPLREHPYQREELYRLYLKALKANNKPYVIIKGKDEKQRLRLALKAIKNL